jgi:hypothetical protein
MRPRGDYVGNCHCAAPEHGHLSLLGPSQLLGATKHGDGVFDIATLGDEPPTKSDLSWGIDPEYPTQPRTAGEDRNEPPRPVVQFDQVVVGAGATSELQLRTVLVGPEVRDRSEWHPFVSAPIKVGDKVHPCGPSLLYCVGPVLDTYPLVEKFVVPPCNVPSRVDAGGIRRAEPIAGNTVIHA